MRHRHLDNPGYSLADIDDIIARGNLGDWIELGRAVESDDVVRNGVRRIVAARTGDEGSINHDFWRIRLTLRPATREAAGDDP